MGVAATEKSNSYANDVYPNNQHMNLSTRDVLLEIKYNPVDVFFSYIFTNVSFDNAICAKIIVYPNNKWQLKMITITISPSTSSIMCIGDPNMVCYSVKNNVTCAWIRHMEQ